MSTESFIPAEFDCVDCARHIIDCSSDVIRPDRLCATCLMMPGWYRFPEVRVLIDRDHDGLEIWERTPPSGGLEA